VETSSTRVNERFISVVFDAIPDEFIVRQGLLLKHSFQLSSNIVSKVLLKALSVNLQSGKTNEHQHNGSLRIVILPQHDRIDHQFYRKCYIEYVLFQCIFGHNLFKSYETEMVKKSVYVTYIHIISARRMQEIFASNEECAVKKVCNMRKKKTSFLRKGAPEKQRWLCLNRLHHK